MTTWMGARQYSRCHDRDVHRHVQMWAMCGAVHHALLLLCWTEQLKPCICALYTCSNSVRFACLHCTNSLIHTLQTLTMGIPVLLNPFGAERLTRQRLLNAIQQTGWLHNVTSSCNDSLNTCNQDTALPQCCELQNALCYMFFKTVLQVVEAKHCHTEVSLAENGPPEWLGSACWNRSPLPKYTGITQK